MFKGSMPALVTPFKDGAVDFDTLKQLVDWHVDQGSHGLVPVGTTGESPTLTHDEHEEVILCVVEAAAGRIPVIAGAGSNHTDEAVRFMVFAQTVGAAGALVVAPSYHKPTQAGMIAHFKAVHDAVMEGKALRKEDEYEAMPEEAPMAISEEPELSDEDLLGEATLAKLPSRQPAAEEDEVSETEGTQAVFEFETAETPSEIVEAVSEEFEEEASQEVEPAAEEETEELIEETEQENQEEEEAE